MLAAAAGYRHTVQRRNWRLCASLQSSNNWLQLWLNRQLKADSEFTTAMSSKTFISYFQKQIIQRSVHHVDERHTIYAQNRNHSSLYYLHSGLFHLRIICKKMDIFQRASRFFWWRTRPPKTFERHSRQGDDGKSVPTATVRSVHRSRNVKMTLQLCSYESQGSYILMGENGHIRNTNLI